MILQPKRWERADDPKYDPIRHKPWFNRLLKRKKVITRMEGCYQQWTNINGITQQEICDSWNVNSREFRDYCAFKSVVVGPIEPVFQIILDVAYNLYCDLKAEYPIQKYIEFIAPSYGLKGRPVWELWETHPKFYPTGYTK